jgi:uncharacterized protein YbcI
MASAEDGRRRTAERPASTAATISDQMVRLVAQYTGRGPTRARTTLNTNIAVVTFQDTLTRGEQQLVAAGQRDAVLLTRRTFHDVMRPDAIRTVQKLLDRRVVSCLADIDPDANVACIVFVFEPWPESGRVDVAEANIEPPS